jgi:tripartite ATP-independent transporter DctM subunit
MLVAYILIATCITILLGFPIAGALGLIAGVIMIATSGTDLLLIFIQRTYAATTSFPLLAIPFFILAGNLMNVGGTTERIFEVAKLLVGRVRGGLAYVNVIGSMIFAGMSGSAVADAAGLGVIEIRAMVKEGYKAKFAATISAVSATIGPIIPPSIPFVIYGSLANVSVGALFLAGIIPGLLMGIGLMIAIGLQAKKLNLPVSEGVKFGSEALTIFLKAIPALALPPAILVAIFSGVVTPTEAAVLATAYAFVLGQFVYRELTWQALIDTVWESGRQTAQVLFIIAMSAPFGWVLIQQQVPNQILQALMKLSADPLMILLIINLILLFLGMFLETIAIMIITYPILAPVIVAIGIDPIHFGVIMVVNMMIGLVTPPVGLCLFVVSGIAKVPIADIVSELAPYLLAMVVVLGLVTYVPSFSMWLPQLFGFGLIK